MLFLMNIFSLTLIATICYRNSLHITSTLKIRFWELAFIIILTSISYITDKYMPYITILVLFMLSSIFLSLLHRG